MLWIISFSSMMNLRWNRFWISRDESSCVKNITLMDLTAICVCKQFCFLMISFKCDRGSYLKRYFPLPCPKTGSMIPCPASSLIRSEALDGLRSITFIKSERPKIAWLGKASLSFNIWLTVFGWKIFTMSGFKVSMSDFDVSMSGFSTSLNAPLICNVRLCRGWFSFSRRLRRKVSRYSVVSWIPFFRSL